MSDPIRLHLARGASILVTLLAILFCLPGALDAAPATITIQGKLADAAGRPLNGVRAYRIRFFDAETAGNALGAPFQGMTTVSLAGRFSIDLAPPAEALAVPALSYELAMDSAATPDGAIGAADVFPNRVSIASVMFAQKLARDGEGSGVDADLLDGRHAAEFATTTGLVAGLAGKADAAHSHNLQDLGGALADAQIPDNITIVYAAAAGVATTATFAELAATARSADNATTAIFAESAATARSADNATTAIFAEAAATARSADNATTAIFTETAATARSADNATTAIFAEMAATARSADNATTALFAGIAAAARSADNATTAIFAETAATARSADNATSAVFAETASAARSADNATTAAFAEIAATAHSADIATTAAFAQSAATAQHADRLGDLSISDFATTSNLAAALAGKTDLAHSHNLQNLDGAVTDAQVPDDITITERDTLQTVTNRGAVTTQAIQIANTNNALSANTGALVVAGGAGFGGNLYANGALYAEGRRVMTWRLVTTDTQAESNCDYVAANTTATIVLSLPAAPAIGDLVRVSALEIGGWRLAQNDAQKILIQGLKIPSYNCPSPKAGAGNWTGVVSSYDGARWAACTDGGIFLSSDSGITWTTAALIAGCQSIASSADGSRLAVCGNGFVYVSGDAGSTWTLKTPPPALPARNWGAIACSANGNYWGVYDKSGYIYTSNNFGDTWTPRIGSERWSGLAVSADGAQWVVCQDGGVMQKSSNYGANWTYIASFKKWKSVASSADGRVLAGAADNDHIYVSYDYGATWEAKESVRAWTCIAMTPDGAKIAAANSAGAPFICFSTDGGAHWQQAWGMSGLTCIAFSADGAQITAGYSGANLYRYLSIPVPVFTTAGSSGYLSGGQYSAMELRYAGKGIFIPTASAGAFGAR
ncbi:MAG: sialidase family protein [Candidatus Sumerlaeota bacterium]|nr:sialidase family protein [Candidatus Sumerlaeota bacterium]